MKARVRAGDLNRPLAIQTRSVAVDGEGNPITTWIDGGRTWGHLQQQAAAEVVQAGQLEQDVRWIVTLHYPTTVTHESRLLYGSRVLDVRTVIDVDEANRKVQVVCLERQVGG